MMRSLFVLGWHARGMSDRTFVNMMYQKVMGSMNLMDSHVQRHWNTVGREQKEMDDEINRLMEE
jgi:hypothetical protein